MKKGNFVRYMLVFILVGTEMSLPAEAGPPKWLVQLQHHTLKEYPRETEAVTLLDEAYTVVTSKGEIRTRFRVAKKILSPKGRSRAWIRLGFDEETAIRKISAWNLKPDGIAHEVSKKEALETQFAAGILYQDNKVLLLQIPQVDVGSVIGYEYEQRRRPYILQDFWNFQGRDPVVRSSFQVELPKKWNIHHQVINWSDLSARRVAANRWLWELEDLPPIPREPRMPPLAAVIPQLAVAYVPDRINQENQAFQSWDEVAAWFAGLMIPRAAPGPSVTSTAEKMEGDRDLAEFVQKNIRYVAIEIGIGGYRPHFADDTLEQRYGDCKDKVTLLNSLMRAQGRRLHPVLIHTERGRVIPEFPSPLYFNHVIVAIPVGEAEAHLPAVLQHPKLGRLLLFDPTDERTAYGELPPGLQGTKALLLGPERGFLIETPVGAPIRNRILRTGRFELTSDGLLKGQVSERFWGAAAARERHWLLESTHEQWIINTEEYLSRWLPGAKLTQLGVGKPTGTGTFAGSYQFVAPHFGQQQDVLYMFKPCVFGSKLLRLSGEKKRRYPLHFTTLRRDSDVFKIVLPEGYRIDELPQPVEEDFPFALYTASFTLEGRILKYVRTLEIKQMSVEPDQVETLRRFYRRVEQDENRFIFLRREE